MKGQKWNLEVPWISCGKRKSSYVPLNAQQRFSWEGNKPDMEFPLWFHGNELTGIHEDLGLIPGLAQWVRNWRCYELWCRSQMWDVAWICHWCGCGCGVGWQLQLWFYPNSGNLHVLQLRPPKKSKNKQTNKNTGKGEWKNVDCKIKSIYSWILWRKQNGYFFHVNVLCKCRVPKSFHDHHVEMTLLRISYSESVLD